MQEHHVTVAGQRHDVPAPFHVLATQNPLEQEGTYPLPEAQLDRFLMHVTITYPSDTEEKSILHLARNEARSAQKGNGAPAHIIRQQDVFDARRAVLDMYMSDDLEQYLLEIVLATRKPAVYGDDLADWLEYGASPRASIALDRCARAHAWLDGRDYVGPDDIQAIARDVLRHRVILTYEAVADGITTDRFVDELIARIAVP
jgi:MoxR-like ATPase